MKGVSLVECIVSVFVLTVAMLLMVNLFHASLRYQRELEVRSQALLQANARLAEVRAWARDPDNFASGWGPYNGTTFSDPLTPNITLRVDCDPNGRPLYTPCQSLEAPYGADARILTRTVVPVRVTASWGGTGQLTVFTYVGQPVPAAADRTASVLILGAVASPMPSGATAPLSVSGTDGAGRPLHDMLYEWNVQSDGGNARIQPGTDRVGRAATLENLVQLSPVMPPASVPGDIQVKARTRYHGTPLEILSAPVTMQ